ncbi:MAG: dihydrodipicolinate synthase family protein [Sulfolobales archaeon]
MKGLRELIDLQLGNGVVGFFILGTYGEGLSLHHEKRKRFVEKVAEYAGSKAVIINNVSSTSLEVGLELAKHSLDVGVANISLIPPLYYKTGVREIVRYYKAFESLDVNIMIYNNPARVGVDIQPSTLKSMLSDVSNIVGIKDSTGLPDRIMELVTGFGKELHIAAASDSLLLEAFLYRADTHICGICNAVPEISDLMYKSIVMGDMEKAVKYKSLLMRIKGLAREFQVEGLSIVKAILRLRGLSIGNPVPPIKGLSDSEMGKLREILESILSDAGVSVELKRIL